MSLVARCRTAVLLLCCLWTPGIGAGQDDLVELNNRAVALARDGRLEEAYALLQKAIASDPRFAVVHGNLTRVVEELSRRDYGKALEVKAPPSTLALRTLAPAAVAAPEVTAPADDAAAIRQMLADWSRAWSAQDVAAYLAFYDETFVPPAGMDRAGWEALRRERLRRPRWVAVQVDDIVLVEQSAQRARVRFEQRYRSDRYRDRTRKELELRRTERGWRIVAERSL